MTEDSRSNGLLYKCTETAQKIDICNVNSLVNRQARQYVYTYILFLTIILLWRCIVILTLIN